MADLDAIECDWKDGNRMADLDAIERALVPVGYLCLHEGGYNHDEIPSFSPVYVSSAGPCNLTVCWPIYDLDAISDAVLLVRSNMVDPDIPLARQRLETIDTARPVKLEDL